MTDSDYPPPRVLSNDPLATECPPEALSEPITPTHLHYIRNHFAVPVIAAEDFRLEIQGAVGRPQMLPLSDLQRLPARTLSVTLECAGNGRSRLAPKIPGLQFHYGAVSTAQWTGTPLSSLLRESAPAPDACEVVFTGADQDDKSGRSFSRSLPLGLAFHPDLLLAYAMNEAPIAPEYGGPVRLIVPGWYGMASVKWLSRIEVVTQPFDGHFQLTDYRYRQDESESGDPVREIRVRSLFCLPSSVTLAAGPQRFHGVAWSGHGPIVVVECSPDNGKSWEAADLAPATDRYAWQSWEWRWEAPPGRTTLLCRAFDAAGNSQPLEQAWNLAGYGNNAVQSVVVEVKDPAEINPSDALAE